MLGLQELLDATKRKPSTSSFLRFPSTILANVNWENGKRFKEEGWCVLQQLFSSSDDPNDLATDSECSPAASPKKSRLHKSKAKASVLSEPEDIPDSEEDPGHFQSQLVIQ